MDSTSIPVAHVDEPDTLPPLLAALRRLHGPDYDFAVGRWSGPARFSAPPGRQAFRFVVAATGAGVLLRTGDPVRGPSSAGPYRPLDGEWAAATADHLEAVWPGDVLCGEGGAPDLGLEGEGTYFQVVVERTAYRAPRLAMLRHLPDRPAGCAAYTGAFRREALPPQRPEPGAADRRGVNRVNEHTLDMRPDRNPLPIRHYHGPVACGDHGTVNHSETAIVLPRSVYGLPATAEDEAMRMIAYRRPREDPADTFVIPVRPGTIVVTPATGQWVAGHQFINAFAMLVAIPGFVSPYTHVAEAKSHD